MEQQKNSTFSSEELLLLSGIKERVQSILSQNEDGHDWDHTLRVRKNALEIGQKEKGTDLFILEAAALLHDIARPEESHSHGKIDHAVLGAERVRKLLPSLGFTDIQKVEAISECIRSHRFRKREGQQPPSSLEAKILFDADKLDSLGAIGIARAMHFAGHIGARVHNTAEEALASDSYSHEDSAYREYLVKLRHLSKALLTTTGKQMAAHREAFMHAFFEELNQETEL